MAKLATPFALRDSLNLEQSRLLRVLAEHYFGDQFHAVEQANESTSTPLAASELAFLEKHGLHLLYSHLPFTRQQEKSDNVRLGIVVNDLQTKSLSRVLFDFAQAGLPPPIVFKGSALGPLEYAHAWQRPKSDHDLLIPYRQKQAYHQALIAQGFAHNIGNAGHYISYQNSYVKKIGAAAHIWIDLHWRISNRQLFAPMLAYAELALQARPFPRDEENSEEVGAIALAPSRADCIVLAAQHIIGHHSQDTRLLWFFDLLLLSYNCSASDLQTLLARCEQLRVAGIVLATIEYAETLFKPVLGDTTRSQLQALAGQVEASQILLKHPHTRARLIWWDLWAIATWRGRLRFIREHIFPQRAYMQTRFPSRWLWISHVKRWLGQ